MRIWNLLCNLSKAKVRYNFIKADLKETAETLRNPERGWYQIYTFDAKQEPDFAELSWCIDSEESLVLIIINIGAYREQSLDEAAFEHIRRILRFFIDSEKDIVLRIVYDHEGNALEKEPFFFTRVVEHLHQLTPIINEFSDAIFVYQGMLIGNWGEMHTSRFMAPSKLKEMWSILRERLDTNLSLAVRRPVFWRILHPDDCGRLELSRDNTGLFDDAIFGSENHLGTFGVEPKESTSWDCSWMRADELAFEDKLCRYAPNGGEVVCGENYMQSYNQETTLGVLKQMHITYLNNAYDPAILDIWKNWKCEVPGIWQERSFYDYVGQHLGYRFWIKDASVSLKDKKEEQLTVAVTIENTGFANIYQETELLLIGIDEQGESFSQEFAYDMRELHSGTAQTISMEMNPVNCKLYLAAGLKKNGKKIYFANQSEKNGNVALGQITDVQLR